MSIQIGELNVWAILVATVISMAFGALWYSPLLFVNKWMKLVGITEMKTSGGQMFGTVVMTLIGSVVLAIVIQLAGAATAYEGFVIALLLSLVLAAKLAVNYFFEGKSMKLYALTIGFHVIPYLAGGIVLAVWK